MSHNLGAGINNQGAKIKFKCGPLESECEFAGHEWEDAGGGLEICALCEEERWAESEESESNET